jgi:hypothetical protein
MSASSRFSPQDWEATLVACHYHPKHVKELMKLRDDMHDYEMHVHRLATDPNHKVPDPPNVTMRLGQIIGDDAMRQFSRDDESPLELACRLSGIGPADVIASLPSEFSRQLDDIGPVEFGQKSFDWDETAVHRETSAHDGKKPGEFAPKHDFPAINAVKDEYKFPERLNKLTAILDAHQTGDVPKAQFEMAKSHLNWIKDAKRHLLDWMHADRDGDTDAEHPPMSPAESEAVREAYYGFNKKSIKALEKLNSDHPAVKYALALNAELDKLGSHIESMKDRVVTAAQQREAKKAAAVRAEKSKPVTSLSKVVAEATETLRPQMTSFFKRVMTDRLSLLNRMVDEYNSQEIPKSTGIRLTKEERDAEESRSRKWKSIQVLFSEVRNCLSADASVMEGNHKFDDARLESQSNAYATGVIEGMRSKINQKLEDLDDASFRHASGGENTFGLHGTRDGKKVEIQQSVKWNVSSLGNPFNQYPALIYVDGKSVSEAKYKSMFSQKPEHPSSEPEKPKGSAQSFISTVREMGYKNPFSNETVVGNAAVELHASPDGSVWLKSIRALTPKKGDGSAMLKQLTKLADENGVEIKGEAVPFGKSMSAAKLKKWYVAHGFTLNGEEFTYTPTPRLKIGSGPMRSIPIEQPEQE